MKKNRRRPQKMSVMAVRSTCLVVFIVSFLAAGVLQLCASTTCKQLEKEIGAKENELVRLENSRKRASSAWEQMKSPASLDAALLKHGLAMRTAKPEQVVRMKGDVTPYPGQLSLAWARQRFSGVNTAMNAPVRPAPAPRRANRRRR